MLRHLGENGLLALGPVLLTLSTGCAPEIPEYFGPLCDMALNDDWSPAATRPELDHVDYIEWIDDPELEALLLGHGMDHEWERLSGNDINEQGIIVSPYGKTLNAYELIVTTPGLEGWGEYVGQHSYPVHGSCGQMAPRVVSHAYSGRQGYRIDVFEIFYERDVVSRAGFLIHEVGHAAGMPGHVDEKDRSWERCGSYRLQLEFLAAVYYAEGSPEAYRSAARAEFNWIMKTKFVEPTGMTLEDFEVFDDYTVE